ncbi:MAG: hypothetical protein AAGA80_19860 [Cyanobacteria bacterium P01_F01_bin.143]
MPDRNGFCQLKQPSSLLSLFFALVIFLPTELAFANEEKTQLAKSRPDYPLVESANLDTNLDVPWSEPAVVQDPFEGEFIGVFDRHYFSDRLLNTRARIEVVSLWSADTIRFLLAFRDRSCIFNSSFSHQTVSRDCSGDSAVLKVTNVYLKLEDEVVLLEGKNNRFAVNDELAIALKNLPTENLAIRLVVENGEIVDSVIGEETVKALQEVYE